MPIVLDGTANTVTPLNGALGATTPSTVVATTISGTDLTTTGNTILGNASTDTLNVGNGGLIKDASGNLLVGAADTSGSLSNATSIVGGLFTTFNGSASSASGVVTNFATLPNVGNGLFLVSVGLAASAVTTYNPTALIRTSGTNAAQTNLSTATTASISLSGLTVRFSQSSGGTNGWIWSIIRLS
jgi:hypothetical protein